MHRRGFQTERGITRGRRQSFFFFVVVVVFHFPLPVSHRRDVRFGFLNVHTGGVFVCFFSSPGNQNETERVDDEEEEEDEGLVLDARNFLPGRKSLLYVRVLKMI